MHTDPTPNVTIDELISYAQTFSDKFVQTLEGESEKKIANYERRVKASLPQFYREYLERMGRCDNSVFSSTEVCTKLERLQEFMDEEIDTGEDQIAPGCILIGLGASAVEQIWMDAASPHAIHEGSLGEKLSLWSDSFAKLLFRNVFVQYHFRKLHYSQVYSILPKFNLIKEFKPMIGEFDAKSLWFSDRVCICAEGPRFALVLHQLQPTHGTDGVWVRVSSNHSSEIERVVTSLHEKLKVTLQRTA